MNLSRHPHLRIGRANGRAFVALVGILALGVGCETNPPAPEEGVIHRGATFEIRMAPTVTVAVDRGAEYAVHYFRVGSSKCQMGVYEGQKPHLFSSKEKDLSVMRRNETSRPGIPRGDNVWGVDPDGKVWRESVWSCVRTVQGERGKSFQIPTFIHIWYFGATDEEQQVFDGMVENLQMLP
jgi:hypothetical protein